MKNNSSVSGIP